MSLTIILEIIVFWSVFSLIACTGFFLIFFKFKAYKREKQRGIEIRKFLNTNRNAFRN